MIVKISFKSVGSYDPILPKWSKLHKDLSSISWIVRILFPIIQAFVGLFRFIFTSG